MVVTLQDKKRKHVFSERQMTGVFAFSFKKQKVHVAKNIQLSFNTFCHIYGNKTRLAYAHIKTRHAGHVWQVAFQQNCPYHKWLCNSVSLSLNTLS